jgi:hypothetical protein
MRLPLRRPFAPSMHTSTPRGVAEPAAGMEH